MENTFLTGERIYLRPIQESDLPLIRGWYNEPELRKLTGMPTPWLKKDAQEWFEEMGEQNNSRIWFTIVLKDNNRVIGETGLLRIFYPWRTTDLTIIIGDKEQWHKGYGKEAILLLLDYAFGHLNLNRVAIGVVGFNHSALDFYRHIGFVQEGIQRDGYYYDYRYHDFIMMSILAKEFKSKYIDTQK